jgi:carbon monoxide dehydrogenase subunit G
MQRPTKATGAHSRMAGGSMIIEQQVIVDAPVDRVWDFVMDVPAVSRCVPGVEEFEAVGQDTYQGAVKVKVGPIAVRLQGRVILSERDPETHTARLDVMAAERRIASTVNAKTTLSLVPRDDGTTELRIHTDAAVLGKLGEFGQAVLKRKADQLVEEFARNMARAIAD